MWGKNCTKLFLSNFCQTLFNSDKFWHTYTLVNFLQYMYFTFSIEWKTENQLEIHLLHLLADKNEHIHDFICRDIKSEKINN